MIKTVSFKKIAKINSVRLKKVTSLTKYERGNKFLGITKIVLICIKVRTVTRIAEM